jgi:hypothetical protein
MPQTWKKIVLLAGGIWVVSLLLPGFTRIDQTHTSIPGLYCFLMGWTVAFSLPGLAWLANIPFLIALKRMWRGTLDQKTVTLAGVASILTAFAFTLTKIPANEGVTRYDKVHPSLGCYVWIVSIWLFFICVSILSRRNRSLTK